MEEMLSFISERVKQTSGKTMRELVTVSGMTKSKFYRYMQEPWRFSKEQIDSIERYLCLNSDEKELFDALCSQHEGKREEHGNNLVRHFLFNSWTTETDFQSKYYTLFNPNSISTNVSRLSSKELVDAFRQWIDSQNLPKDGHFFNVRIINCLNTNKIKLIYSVLSMIQEIDIFSKCNTLPRHVVDSSQLSLEDKIRSIHIANSLFNLNNYVLDYMPLDGSMWSGIDFCLAEYTFNNQQKLVISMIFPTDTDALIYVSKDRLLFDYITFNSEKIFQFDATNAFAPNDPVALNRFLIQATLANHKVMISHELCYDCFCEELWKEVKDSLWNKSDLVHGLRLFADPKNELSPFTDTQFIDYLFESCQRRYTVSETNRSINIIFSSGLQRFAQTGTTMDFECFHFCLSDAQILIELRNIRERLGDHTSERKQSYLIVSPTCRIRYHVLTIFRDHLFYYFTGDYYAESALSTGSTHQPEISTALYDYIIEEILPNDRRQAFDSPVMSDEKAYAFLDSLIAMVQARIRKHMTTDEK